MTVTTIVYQRPDLVAADMDGAIVMMDIQSGKYYKLDEIGSDIWKGIEKPISVEALVRNLLKEYKVSRSQCEKDVLSFLEDLEMKGIIIAE